MNTCFGEAHAVLEPEAMSDVEVVRLRKSRRTSRRSPLTRRILSGSIPANTINRRRYRRSICLSSMAEIFGSSPTAHLRAQVKVGEIAASLARHFGIVLNEHVGAHHGAGRSSTPAHWLRGRGLKASRQSIRVRLQQGLRESQHPNACGFGIGSLDRPGAVRTARPGQQAFPSVTRDASVS
jgi:hypothetical protein